MKHYLRCAGYRHYETQVSLMRWPLSDEIIKTQKVSLDIPLSSKIKNQKGPAIKEIEWNNIKVQIKYKSKIHLLYAVWVTCDFFLSQQWTFQSGNIPWRMTPTFHLKLFPKWEEKLFFLKVGHLNLIVHPSWREKTNKRGGCQIFSLRLFLLKKCWECRFFLMDVKTLSEENHLFFFTTKVNLFLVKNGFFIQNPYPISFIQKVIILFHIFPLHLIYFLCLMSVNDTQMCPKQWKIRISFGKIKLGILAFLIHQWPLFRHEFKLSLVF